MKREDSGCISTSISTLKSFDPSRIYGKEDTTEDVTIILPFNIYLDIQKILISWHLETKNFMI